MVEELFRSDAYLPSCSATIVSVSAEGIELDRTVFYPLGGGQPGDTGTFTLSDGTTLPVLDTRKASDGRHLHLVADDGLSGDSLVGQTVEAEIDWDRRHRMMRVHTCLHLLCAVVPEPVTGGAIRDNGTGRLDFNIPEPRLDKTELTDALNALVLADTPIEARWISDAELAAQPDLVRTMSVQPPSGHGQVRLLDIRGVDLQPCGGTHVASTAEIGSVTVSKIEKKGRQNRRITVTLS